MSDGENNAQRLNMLLHRLAYPFLLLGALFSRRQPHLLVELLVVAEFAGVGFLYRLLFLECSLVRLVGVGVQTAFFQHFLRCAGVQRARGRE